MNTEMNISIDSGLLKRFEMALQLNEESKEQAMDTFIKSYIARTFLQEATSFEKENQSVNSTEINENYGKAINRIPKWAKRHNQINHKIIRAYLQLAEGYETVTYNMLIERCSDTVNHADVYVPTFSQNFAQMKFDEGNSHGKIFEVNENGIVTIWEHVAYRIAEFKKDFLYHTTDTYYVNDNRQRNMGKTNIKGTDHMQYLYRMRCEDCGYEYTANGTDIFLKKCPLCQGGSDTGKK